MPSCPFLIDGRYLLPISLHPSLFLFLRLKMLPKIVSVFVISVMLGHPQPYSIFCSKLHFGVKSSPTPLHIQLQVMMQIQVYLFCIYSSSSTLLFTMVLVLFVTTKERMVRHGIHCRRIFSVLASTGTEMFMFYC